MTSGVNFKKFFVVFFMCLCLGISGTSIHAADDIAELTRQAEQGDASGQFYLGVAYYLGEGISQDYKKALHYFELAAEQGNAEAQYNLGNMYADGQGVPQDDKKAVYYYELAAKQGEVWANNNLAVQYGLGQGVPQDDVKAYAYALIAYALDSSTKSKEILEPKLTPSQREQAQALAAKMWDELPK